MVMAETASIEITQPTSLVEWRRLDQPISLPELARACKLSPGHFARAFRKMTGQPPHRWLMEQRIEKAKQLLVDSTLSLAQIALTCGFADQSHFTRVFAQLVQSS